MTWYEFLLFVHVTAAVIWLGGAFTFQMYGAVVRRGGDTDEIARFAGRAGVLGERMFVPASVVVILAGIGMMIDGNWDWGQLWVVFALVTFAASFVTGLFVISPMAKRIPEVGPSTPAGQELIRRLFTVLRIDLVYMYAIVFAMTVKPTTDDGWTILIAAAVLVDADGDLPGAAPWRGGTGAAGSGDRLVRFQLDEEGAAGDAVALLDVHGLHGRVVGRGQRRLHLHRLQHQQRLPRLDAVARSDLDADHRSRHRSRDVAAAGAGGALVCGGVDVGCGRWGQRAGG